MTRAAPVSPAPVSPAPVWNVINGFAGYWALHTAVELGLFDALAAAPLSAAGLADAIGVDADDLTVLAQLLVALELLDTDGATFTMTPAAQRFLVLSSPAAMTELVRSSPGPQSAWPALAATMRDGAPAASITVDHVALVRATAPTQFAVASAVAAHGAVTSALELNPTVVDLGCGSGAWLDALLASARGGARGVAVDSEPVLAVARETLDRRAINYVAGDYLDTELPVDRAGVVVLAHVLRAESAARAGQLLHRALDLLAPGGVLAVADYFRPDDGAQSADYRAARHDLTLALTMRASTAGRGITERWLRDTAAEHGGVVVDVVEPLPRQRVLLLSTTVPGKR